MNQQCEGDKEQSHYRRILGIRFFVGDAPGAVEAGLRGGLVVVPAAPALLELGRDKEYRRALLDADLAITDSGFMVLLWNAIMRDSIRRVSGLEYLRLLLQKPEFRDSGNVFWVMPSKDSWALNSEWLRTNRYPAGDENCYLAPKYGVGEIRDSQLLEALKYRRPRHVIIALGGGVQEKLGLYLKENCDWLPVIHCVGAAVGFLNGDQVRIPEWADRWILGWLFRCASNPRRFIPRYLRAFQLALVLWRYRSRIPVADQT